MTALLRARFFDRPLAVDAPMRTRLAQISGRSESEGKIRLGLTNDVRARAGDLRHFGCRHTNRAQIKAGGRPAAVLRPYRFSVPLRAAHLRGCVRAATNFFFLRRNSIFDSPPATSSANLCRRELMRVVAGVR
jgi:hypothetical protein